MILLTAEVMELKANPNRAARGLVIEADWIKEKEQLQLYWYRKERFMLVMLSQPEVHMAV